MVVFSQVNFGTEYQIVGKKVWDLIRMRFERGLGAREKPHILLGRMNTGQRTDLESMGMDLQRGSLADLRLLGAGARVRTRMHRPFETQAEQECRCYQSRMAFRLRYWYFLHRRKFSPEAPLAWPMKQTHPSAY